MELAAKRFNAVIANILAAKRLAANTLRYTYAHVQIL